MENAMKLPYRRSEKSSETSAAPSLSKVGAVVTIVSTLAAGFWITFQFTYSKWVEPRLSPAVIQISTDATYVATTKCCYLYEVNTKLENKGRREAIIHASHQVVGARRLATYDDTSKPAVEAMNAAFWPSALLTNLQTI